MGITPVDNSESNYQQQWSTPIAGLLVLAGVGLFLLVAAILMENNAPGQLITSTAGLAALINAGLTFRRRPRLAVDAGPALVLGRLRHPDIYLPNEIQRVRTTSLPRLGRKSHLLELELRRDGGDEQLVVLSRWDLGADPRDVLPVLERFGLTG